MSCVRIRMSGRTDVKNRKSNHGYTVSWTYTIGLHYASLWLPAESASSGKLCTHPTSEASTATQGDYPNGNPSGANTSDHDGTLLQYAAGCDLQTSVLIFDTR